MNILGTNVKRFRQKMGWSQAITATKLNLSIPAWSKIETGITDINISRLIQIAELFETHIPNLIFPAGAGEEGVNLEIIKDLKDKIAASDSEIIKLQHTTIRLYEEIRREESKFDPTSDLNTAS